jgi:hypothetical protein
MFGYRVRHDLQGINNPYTAVRRPIDRSSESPTKHPSLTIKLNQDSFYVWYLMQHIVISFNMHNQFRRFVVLTGLCDCAHESSSLLR